MKNTFLTVIAATFTLIGTQAYACYWDGYYGGPMDRYWLNSVSSSGYQNMQIQTKEIQQQIISKKAEYDELLSAPKPDLKKAAIVNNEIMALYETLVTNSSNSNLPRPVTNPGNPYGRRSGYGMPW